MSSRPLVQRLDAYQRQHPWLSFPLATVYKFYDDQGTFLAALITYYGFVSLFPLLLVFVTILGFLLSNSPDLQQRLLDSAVAQFPIIGDQIAKDVSSIRGSGPGLVVGLLGTLYGGMRFAQAAQNAVNRIWAVPRNERPNPIRSRVRSLLVLLLLGAGVLATTFLSGVTTAADAYDTQLGFGVRLLATGVSMGVNVVLFLAAFRVLTVRDVSTRDIRPGAIIAAVLWQLLQFLGTYFLSHQLKGATAVYGLFGIVLGLLAWIYLEALILIFCAEINVVARERLWPRALLTPVTDDVDLTGADKKAYTAYASTERFKGFEDVDVSFDKKEGRDRTGGVDA